MSSPVAIVMGSQSDWATMKCAADALEKLGVAFDARIVSAHRTPARLVEFAQGAEAEGFKVIIAGAGGAAHLPGMVASMTHLPVLGVPVQSKALSGQDSLLSIVQMPAGIPVGTLAIGEAGATNAGLLAAAILGLNDPALAERLKAYRTAQSAGVAAGSPASAEVAVAAISAVLSSWGWATGRSGTVVSMVSEAGDWVSVMKFWAKQAKKPSIMPAIGRSVELLARAQPHTQRCADAQ